jgi:hypothetical protein
VASDRVEWLVRQVEAWNARDFDGFLDGLAPDFEFTPDPSFPDTATDRAHWLTRQSRGVCSGLQDLVA